MIEGEDGPFQVLTAPEDFNAVQEAFEAKGIKCIEASVAMIPQNTIEVSDEKVAARVLKLMETLEDNDDVQNVYANFDIPDEIMEKLS